MLFTLVDANRGRCDSIAPLGLELTGGLGTQRSKRWASIYGPSGAAGTACRAPTFPSGGLAQFGMTG